MIEQQAYLKGHILLKPHLRQFVVWLEKVDAEKPMRLSQYSLVGLSFINFVFEDKFSPTRETGSDVMGFTDRLDFEMPRLRWADGLSRATVCNFGRFNQFLHHLLHEMLLARVMVATAVGRSEKDAIHDFLREIGIEEMIDSETVEKASYRLRVRRGVVFKRGSRRSHLAAA
jgi:hypothetical protein